MSHNITVQGGKSVRLKTAGKYCDRDIVITAEGGTSNSINEFLEGTLEEIDCDGCTTINSYFFYQNPGIKKVILKNVTSVGAYNFAYCDGLESVDLPMATGSFGNYPFYHCDNLANVNVPYVTELGQYAFQSCPKLTKLDFHTIEKFGNYALRYTTSLETLILRNTNVVVARGSSVLSGSGIANKKGYIYVPSAMVEDYKSATGWSAFASQIRAIEDYPEITGG